MELILFIGLQALGKSSFYKERFFHSHVRINLDMLKTRHRERTLFQTCLALRQPCVIDNTNTSHSERAPFLKAAQAAKFRTIGYYFQADVEACLRRNAQRGYGVVPDKAIYGTLGRLERPQLSEGFDQLFYVKLDETGFVVEEWKDGL